MEVIKSIITWILNLGSIGMLPIIVFLITLVFRIPVKKGIRAALMMGIGLNGILTVVTAILLPTITPVLQAISQRLGVKLEIIDVGWAASGASWAWPGAFAVIPLFLVLDVILISLKITRLLWIDVWGFWNALFVGGMVWAMTDKVLISIIVAIVIMTLQMLMGDWSANKMQEYFELPGCAWEVYSCSLYQWTAPLLDKIISVIPGVRKINMDPETIEKELGFIGEPVTMGFIIGALLGLLSGLGGKTIILTGIAVAATMVILPKMISILMEGIMPITSFIRDFMRSKFKDREILITLDNATLLGHPSVIASSLIAMPLLLLLAGILPGNRIMPIASLAAVPWWTSSFAAQTKGNVFKMVIMMLFWGGIALYASTFTADAQTLLLHKTGIIKEGMVGTLTPADGISFLIYWIIKKLGLDVALH